MGGSNGKKLLVPQAAMLDAQLAIVGASVR
jgi:hypothetical protein